MGGLSLADALLLCELPAKTDSSVTNEPHCAGHGRRNLGVEALKAMLRR
jgi:hypothetical protein